jgi:hypothetical protein
MPRRLSRPIRDNLEKCRAAAIAAVAAYNRPGEHFRTAQYIVLITIAWTALFHAIFYKRGRRPWYRKKTSGTGRGIRYLKVDGEPKHWDLSECLNQYFTSGNPPERKNLEFLIGLRNKIEHRHLPELDPSLYGECQAALMNLESLLVQEFGQVYALAESLAIALQFTQIVPTEKKRAARTLARGTAKSVLDYIERFRKGLPTTVLNSMRYSFSVYLVPRVANRANAADAAVEFVKVDEASPDELKRLERLNVLIREKHIPIVNLELYKVTQVVDELTSRLPYRITIPTHTDAWRHYQVRPPVGDGHPERTSSQYCVYDTAHNDYLYTRAWIEKLARDLASPDVFRTITGREPKYK